MVRIIAFAEKSKPLSNDVVEIVLAICSAVEHAVILVGIASDHVGTMTVISREVEAGLVPEMDVTEFVAVHIGRCQSGVA